MRAFTCLVVIAAMSGCAERDPKALTVKVSDSTTVPEVLPARFPTHETSEQQDFANSPEVIEAKPWYHIRGETSGKGSILVYVDAETGIYVGKLNVNHSLYAGMIMARGYLDIFVSVLKYDDRLQKASIEAAQGRDLENINLRVPTQLEISTLRRRLAK